MWMGVFTLHASNIKGFAFEFAHGHPVWMRSQVDPCNQPQQDIMSVFTVLNPPNFRTQNFISKPNCAKTQAEEILSHCCCSVHFSKCFVVYLSQTFWLRNCSQCSTLHWNPNSDSWINVPLQLFPSCKIVMVRPQPKPKFFKLWTQLRT